MFVICADWLQVHPDRSEYATVGDDGTLRIWDAVSRKQLRMKTLGGMSRAVAYSPDGKYLAIGYGGRVGGPSGTDAAGANDGSYAVLRSTDLVVSHQARDAAAWISDIKFSPDGKVPTTL
jgi:WD40 repeat protein